MWKYKGEELGLEGITGIPSRDMTDEEFAEAEAKQAFKFRDQPGSLAKSGLWVHEEDEKPRVNTSSRRVEEKPVEVEANVKTEEGDSNG